MKYLVTGAAGFIGFHVARRLCGDGHQVVVYDQAGIFSAPRVWWTFRLMGKTDVAVLDGGLPAWQVLQPEYNLYHRSAFEGALCDLCISREIGVVTYYSLASGFLTGKYRQQADLAQSQRGSGIGKYLNPRGMRIIDTLVAVADEQGAKPAEVALAWLIGREGVTAPIASATSVAQVESFARAAALSLSAEQVARLDGASA